ncbi:TlpA family protein disulfide reductase [Tenacibaculum sp. UWU-22]|uniref:TlpA family protein disulfide reductase n=1 Tax=Tenacibaculum sp. UWU-22 TaxID=3234187 RepID=UPI0034DADC6C
MKKLFVLFVLTTSIIQAQYTIKGIMNPPEKNDWVILYKIEGAVQRFIGNTNTKHDTIDVDGKKQIVGSFEFTLPADAKAGQYRAMYRLKGSGFVDFLFNKEDVEFTFNPDFPVKSITYTKSKENKLYNEYEQALALTQKKLDSLQLIYIKDSSIVAAKKEYTKAYKSLVDAQKIYTDKSKGMLVSNFVKASKRYNAPEITANPQKYFNSVVSKFFDNIDFNNSVLYNSSFLIDRITDYVFLLNYSSDYQYQQKLYKTSVDTVMNKISDDTFKKETLEYLITQFTKMQNAEIVDMLFNKYYLRLPVNLQKSDFRNKTLSKLQAAIGRVAPDFTWKENGKTKSLSSLKDGENYLLVFWSTSCSHCIKEIPELYKFMKTQPKTKVVAYALEKDEFGWNEFIKNLHGWHHAVGINAKNKWDNKLVTDTYRVYATPSYFILDANKKIVAKPYELKDIKKYFEENKSVDKQKK